MDFQFKDIAEATAKALALHNDRVRYWNKMVSETNAIMTVRNIMELKDQYNSLIRWMVADQLIKGYYTSEDEYLGKLCLNEIEECDKALSDCTYKAIADKVISKVTEFLHIK